MAVDRWFRRPKCIKWWKLLFLISLCSRISSKCRRECWFLSNMQHSVVILNRKYAVFVLNSAVLIVNALAVFGLFVSFCILYPLSIFVSYVNVEGQILSEYPWNLTLIEWLKLIYRTKFVRNTQRNNKRDYIRREKRWRCVQQHRQQKSTIKIYFISF